MQPTGSPVDRIRRALQRRLPLLLGTSIALLVGFGPLAVLSMFSDDPPELRVRLAPDNLAVVIADGEARVAILDVTDREVAREMQGALLRSLEPDVQLIIVPAHDGAALGLLEWLVRISPTEIIVAGIAGADADWVAVERHAREHNITLRFVSDRAIVQLPSLELIVYGSPPDADTHAAVAVRDADASITVLVDLGGGLTTPIERTLTVTRRPQAASGLGVLLTPTGVRLDDAARTNTSVQIDASTTTTLRFDDSRLRISDGIVSTPIPSGVNAAPTSTVP